MEKCNILFLGQQKAGVGVVFHGWLETELSMDFYPRFSHPQVFELVKISEKSSYSCGATLREFKGIFVTSFRGIEGLDPESFALIPIPPVIPVNLVFPCFSFVKK